MMAKMYTPPPPPPIIIIYHVHSAYLVITTNGCNGTDFFSGNVFSKIDTCFWKMSLDDFIHGTAIEKNFARLYNLAMMRGQGIQEFMKINKLNVHFIFGLTGAPINGNVDTIVR